MKSSNGYKYLITGYIMSSIAVIVFVAAPVIWAVGVENKVEINKTNLNHVVDDFVEMKDDIKAIRLILEKM